MSGIPTHHVQAALATPLHTDFNPIQRGNFNGRPVQLATANTPLARHAPEMTFGQKVGQFLGRVTNAIFDRAEYHTIEYRLSVRQTAKESQAFTSLILAKDGQANPSKADLANAAQKLQDATGAATRRGTSANALIAARFDVVLERMDQPQILSLKQTLENLRQSPSSDATVDAMLTQMEQSIGRFENDLAQSTLRRLTPDLQRLNQNLQQCRVLKQQNPQPQAQVQQQIDQLELQAKQTWDGMISKAKTLLSQKGLDNSQAHAFALAKLAIHGEFEPLLDQAEQAARTSLTQAAADLASATITQPIADLQTFLTTTLSAQELLQLQDAASPLLTGHDDSAAQTTTMACVFAKLNDAVATASGAYDQLQAFVASGPTIHAQNATNFIAEVRQVMNQQAQLGKVEKALDANPNDLSSKQQEIDQALMQHSQVIGNLLGKCSSTELTKLLSLTRQVSLPQLGGMVQAEMDARKLELQQAFTDSLTEVFASAASTPVNTQALFTANYNHPKKLEILLSKFKDLGENFRDPKVREQLHADLVKKTLASIPVAQRVTYLAALNSPNFTQLRAGLTQIAANPQVQAHASASATSTLSQEITDDLQELQLLESQLRDSLPEAAAGIASSPSAPATTLNLNLEQQNSIAAHYGISIDAQGALSMTKSAELRGTELLLIEPLPYDVERSQGIRLSPTGVATYLNNATTQAPDLLVSEGFTKDLSRANYVIDTPDLGELPLLDLQAYKSLSPSGKDQAIADSAAQLHAFTKDADLTLKITQIANQGLLSSVIKVLNSPASLIQSPDFGSGLPTNGSQSTEFRFQRNEAGDIELNVTYQEVGCTDFQSFEGTLGGELSTQNHPLSQPTGQYQIQFGITIAADLSTRVHVAPIVTYQLP